MFKIVLNLTVTKIYMMNSIGNYTSLKKKKKIEKAAVCSQTGPIISFITEIKYICDHSINTPTKRRDDNYICV